MGDYQMGLTQDKDAKCVVCTTVMTNIHNDDTHDLLWCPGCGSLLRLTWDASEHRETWTHPALTKTLPS